ncbi:UDP-N-acetylmuramate dehydrogenase [Myxococcota bacterium]|nr:UDP-N-acetylmuramate dehydrogenase [Myxococcota bacterium]
MKIEEGVALAPRTTLGVGGPARFFAAPRHVEDLHQALSFAAARGLAVHVLGGGSNHLISDAGFDGLIIHPAMNGLHIEGARLTAGAGVAWDEVVARAVEADLYGIACLSGIPGDAGAAPVQNIGAYGQSLEDHLLHVRALDTTRGEIVELDRAACGFGYRDSRFKAAPGRFIITALTFELSRAPTPLRHAALDALAEGASPAARREAVLAQRRAKSMVFDPADPNHRSVGSFFLNPVLRDPGPILARVRAALGAQVDIPSWPTPEGLKLSAAWLIERAGMARGWGEGRVGLSTRHTLAVINRGGASAEEILAFSRRVQGQVWSCFGVALEPEPVFLGVLGRS